MIDINYEGYGFDTVEQFVPTHVQCNSSFDGEKTWKKDIEYTELESFISEDYPKEDDLLIPMCCCTDKTGGELIEDGTSVEDISECNVNVLNDAEGNNTENNDNVEP